jgi:hypothetical protein
VEGARPTIQLAAAATEVRHDAAPADRAQMRHQRQRVVRTRIAFEAVEEHDQRRIVHWLRRFKPVEVDEVAVGCIDSLPPVGDLRPPEQRRIDRLRVSSG